MERYFASDRADKCIAVLEQKASQWFKGVTDTAYLDKIIRSREAYYGEYYNKNHSIGFSGESGEIVNLAVNHYRNLARHIHVMVTSTRPSFQCRAVNTDRKSLLQANLGRGLLDYYMRELRLEEVLKDAAEQAIVLGCAYIKLEWNSTKGRIYDYKEPDQDRIVGFDEDGNPVDEDNQIVPATPIYEGDVDWDLLSVFDVVFDSTKESYEKNDWVLCRSFVNKFDLAAKYPELSSLILRKETKDKLEKRAKRALLSQVDETVDIPVYEFFHKRTEALPEGRYVLYLDQDIILEDTVMPYRDLPIYRIVPSKMMGTPYGYTDLFDLLPLQDMLNSLYSTAATNINAFGIVNILNPRGNGISIDQVSEGMNFIEYDPQAGSPQALDLVKTSAEVYQMMQIIERTMETISGVNQVARGNPEAQLRSGNALALIQAQALQFVSGLQQSYIHLIENVGTGLINLLKDFADVPRIAAITGMNNSTEMKEFKSDDIRSINRVVVDVGNALMNNAAGRVQVAENLIQMGLIDSPEKFITVLNTGNLDYLTEGKMDEMMVIKAENESLIRGEEVIAVFSDNHPLHIREHRSVLSDPILRKDPVLVQDALDHIQEHINLLKTTDPNILAILGMEPIAPTPEAPPAGIEPQSPEGIPMDQTTAPLTMPGMQQPVEMPQMPTPAGEGTVLPDMPQTPDDMLLRNT